MSEPRQATGIFFSRCPNPSCRALHIDLMDGDEVIACAAVHATEITKLTDHLHGIAYQIATEGDA
jgi:hypothetical protein